MEKSGFTSRAVVVSIILTLFLLATSSYIALRLGALPWPIIFAVIVSAGLMKVFTGFKKTNVHEINVAQAGATIGGLLASGVVFTIPGIWYLNQTQNLGLEVPPWWVLGIIFVFAGLLGVLLSLPLKKTFVDKEKLPYPSGSAGAAILKEGKAGGRMLYSIIFAAVLTGIFALLRELYFPSGLSFAALATAGVFITLYPMPLAAGVGYILGKRPSFSWFLGAVIGWLILVPILVNRGFEAASATSFAQNLGMGLLLGSGIGFFIAYVVPRFKKIFEPVFKAEEWYIKNTPLFSLITIVILRLLGVPTLAAVIAVAGVWIMVAVAARMTGETDINPLEQFGIIIGLVAMAVFAVLNLELSFLHSFLVVAFVAIACAVAGDIGHDFKSAKIIGTKAKDIVKVDMITVIVAGLAAPFVLEVIRRGYESVMFTQVMPAPQATLVASSIFGFAFPVVFWSGFGFAFLVEVINRILIAKKKLSFKVMMMPLGIGLFLGMALAIPLFIGGLVRWFVDKKNKKWVYPGIVIAAGIMGGEGIAGFTHSALFVSGVPQALGGWLLIGVFVVIGAVGLVKKLKNSIPE